ncbi:hypothetical protein NA56DRAFT_711631 [Hyaloscypha hepaticicola]|uniref:Uncharacterized protein n=1 Tax=Hyaloscypha hepaticicola TaxID=2082293 RepID=A0A2J6PIC7_9HELO|nr:hypothetical protein NA56DRAFT_711631 [Hyaloscypha hepaticicola]
MKRTKIGFSKKDLKTAAALETHNRRLRELLDSNDKLDRLRLQKCLSGDDLVFSMAFNIPDELYELPTHAREVIISMKKTCQTNLELIK